VSSQDRAPVNGRSGAACGAQPRALTGTFKVPCYSCGLEKKRPHHDLRTIKSTFCSVESLRITTTALRCVEALGLTLQNVVDIIQRITRQQFHKSMTSIASSAIWQDVYHVKHEGIVLYVKLTTDADGYLIISFKEK
jgi:motility quorum-sensing regulator / GCU-specific mRNA interferase toxin